MRGSLGTVVVVRGPSSVDSDLKRGAIEIEVAGRQVMFCSREDLISMKRASGRLIDRADLERLAELEGR